MKIHVWCPGVDAQAGGIEKYSWFLVSAIKDLYGSDAVSIFAKNDVTSRARAAFMEAKNAHGSGGVPLQFRTPAFSARVAVQAALDRPTLIISTHLNFAPLARWLKKHLAIPYWVSLHGIEAWGVQRTDRSLAVFNADRLLPVSRFTRDAVAKEQDIPLDRFRVVPNTIDSARFNIGKKAAYLQKRYGLWEEQRVIVTVGRLNSAEAYKGHDRILRVLAEIRGQVPDLRYIIIGDGDDRPRLEQLARSKGVAELVIFAGKVPANELNDHYNLCDLFAMPSTGEGFGIVFLEALACGKPVLGGNKDASSEALRDGELGVLVNPDDRSELRGTIVSILKREHPHPLIYQPKILRQKVIEHFGNEKFKNTLTSCLAEFGLM